MARQHDSAKRSSLRRRSKSTSNLTIRNVISSERTDMHAPGSFGRRQGTFPKDPSSLPSEGKRAKNNVDEHNAKNIGPELRHINMQTHLKRCGELEQRCGELEQELEAVTEEWKKSARELNEFQAKTQISGQLTDGNLIERVQQLRYAIWTFSIQNFERERLDGIARGFRTDTEYFWILESITPECTIYQEYLRTPTRRAKIIAAFLWRLLFHRAFGHFSWTTESIARSLEDLREFLQPGNRPPALGMVPPRPEAERAFQMWSTTTMQLVMDAIYTRTSNAEAAEAYLRERKLALRSAFMHTFGLQSGPEIQGITRQLDEILDIAFSLDQDFNQQVARLEWTYDISSIARTDYRFDQETMQLDEGDSVAAEKEGRRVRVVIAPALVKRGRSSGDDFDVERMLLKRVVLCD